MSTTASAPSPRPQRNALVRLFSSIWFGTAIIFAIVIYSSIFSAMPKVRGALELSEMQAFRHWLFVTLVVLFLLSLMAATFLRTRWNWVNAGALITHLGLLLLSAGALWYFGTKVEGDVLLQSPRILVRSAGDLPQNMQQFLAETGREWGAPPTASRGMVHAEVLGTRGAGILPVASATISVHMGDQPPQIITLNGDAWEAGPGGLQFALDVAPPQSDFYDAETPALYIRNMKTGQEIMRALHGLPFHRERYVENGTALVDTLGKPVPSKRIRPELSLLGLTIPTGWFERWRLPIDVSADELPFRLQVTGYVPYVVGLTEVPSTSGPARRVPLLETLDRRLPRVSDTRGASAIQITVTGVGAAAGWSDTFWCLVSPEPEAEPRPVPIRVPGSDTTWTVIYSRLRHPLGATLAGRKLSVTYFPGGWDIESFRSDLNVQFPGGQPEPEAVYTNHTLSLGPWSLYQSGAAGDDWSWTRLGVGNRRGLLLMNLGWIAVTLGCLYAFYVKPLLLRRIRERK